MAASDFPSTTARRRLARADTVNGATIRALREARGITQSDLAARLGMDPAYLSRIETGGRNGASRRGAVAAVLEVPVEVLTGQLPAVGHIREARNIPAAVFAADVGITPEHLHRVETGAELPDETLLLRLANRLAVAPAALRPNAVEALTAGTG